MTPSAPARAPHLAAPETNPSFIRGLFLGELREDLVFPFPSVSDADRESLRMILGSLREFAAASIDSAKMDREGAFPDDVRKGLHALGVMGLAIPEEYGGFGASTQVYSRVFAEIGAIDPALCVYFGAHQSIGCKGIVLFGTEQQKQKYLPRCASGETIAAFCLTEPGSGSDAQGMTTTATLSDDGTHYLLSGTKIWISNAGYADLFTVFAKVAVEKDGKVKQRVTAFLVDAHAPGVSLGKREEKMGIKASDTRAVFFDRVKVPVEDRLGDVGQGFHIALEVLNSGRLGLAAASARGARAAMAPALAYASQRQQFGKPIAEFEMIQRKVAIASADCYAAESAVTVAAGMVDRGGVDFSLETAACKVFASELAYRVANDALQIAGGIGYSKEYPYEQAVRDSRINLIFEGTNEILRALIALMGLQQPGEQLAEVGRAFRDPLHSLGAISHFLAGRARRTLRKPELTRVHALLSEEAEQLGALVHDLGSAVEAVIVSERSKIVDRQFIQERLANAAIDIFVATAVLARTTWELERLGETEAAWQLDCARIFVPMALRRARRALRGVTRHQDERLTAIARRSFTAVDLAPTAPTDV